MFQILLCEIRLLQIQRIFDAEGILPEDYRIVEFYGSTDTFSNGRIVLKVHFSQPGMTEL